MTNSRPVADLTPELISDLYVSPGIRLITTTARTNSPTKTAATIPVIFYDSLHVTTFSSNCVGGSDFTIGILQVILLIVTANETVNDST